MEHAVTKGNLRWSTGRTPVARAPDFQRPPPPGPPGAGGGLSRARVPRGRRGLPRGRLSRRRPRQCGRPLSQSVSALGRRPWRRPLLLSFSASGRRRFLSRRRPPGVPTPSAKVSPASSVRLLQARTVSRLLARRRGVSRRSRALPRTWTPTRPWCGVCLDGIARSPCGTRSRFCPSSGRSPSFTRSLLC